MKRSAGSVTKKSTTPSPITAPDASQEPKAWIEAADGKRIAIYCAYDALLPIAEVQDAIVNPNGHPDEQIELLRLIIEKNGWRGGACCISKRSGRMTKGHGRKLAAIALGMKCVPVNFQPYPNEQAEMTDLLADNKIPLLAETDYQQVAGMLKLMDGAVLSLDATGFRDYEREPLLRADWQPSPPAPPQPPNEQHHTITLSLDQWLIIQKAIEAARAARDANTSDADCLVAICNAFVDVA